MENKIIYEMQTSVENYQFICRACMSKDGITENIYNLKKENAVQLSIMFMSVSTVNICSSDGLPQHICRNCLQTLSHAYQFQQMCIRSDKELRIFKRCAYKNEEKIPLSEPEVAVDVLSLKSSIVSCKQNNRDIKCKNNGTLNNVDQDIKEEGPFLEEENVNKKVNESFIQKQHSFFNGGEDKNEKVAKDNLIVNPLECSVCEKQFDRKYRLKRHLNAHKEVGKPFECSTSKQRFTSKCNLKRHSIVHSKIISQMVTKINKPDTLKCPECSREFQKQEALSSHMRTHKNSTENKEYYCELCPKVFARLNLLIRHAKSHDEMKQHKCNICDKTFALSAQLVDHINKHNGIKPHVCHICQKGFQQSCTLKDHLRTHSGEQPFLCFECGKAFNNGSNLRQHLIRHTGVKPFQCSECPSRFTCKGGLKSHMATHSAVKPFICDVCGSAFTKPYSLAKHKRIHTGEKPYACEVCNMRFNSSDHVKRHMRTHTGEKPYACKFCDRAFAQSNDLVKHMRAHVGEKTYQCQECRAAFRLHSELKVHIQDHFKQQQNLDTADSNFNAQKNHSITR